LNDPLESELGRIAASSIPIGVPGRGANRDKLHFQVALPLIEDSPAGQDGQGLPVQEALRALVQRMRTAWKGELAPPVHVLPPLVHSEDLPAPDKHSGVPLGLEEFRLSPFFIDLVGGGPHFIILGDTECGKTSLLRIWMRGLERSYLPQEAAFAIVDFRKQLLDFSDSKHLLIYAYNSPTLAACIGNLKVDLERRLQQASEVPINTLRKPQGWTGRHYFLFVDDYETLVSAGVSQLAPLADYLLSGREIGFHLILTHRVSGMGRAAYETVFQRLREMGTSAILMSGDPTEGKLLYGQATGPLPAGRGYLVQSRHAPLLVQVAFAQPEYSHA
jgi:S-DNA-T family DNA segregation ATPase FtsK/SpoIIIE